MRRKGFGSYSMPASAEHQVINSFFISKEPEVFVDMCFIPTRGQLIRIQNEGRKLWLKDKQGRWVYYIVDEELNIHARFE